MSGISGASIGGYQSQIADLQQQCADWRGCTTTPANEKQKQISALQSQIQVLQHKVENADQVSSASAAYDVADKITQTAPVTQTSDGINRPDKDAFAVAGSVINLSI